MSNEFFGNLLLDFGDAVLKILKESLSPPAINYISGFALGFTCIFLKSDPTQLGYKLLVHVRASCRWLFLLLRDMYWRCQAAWLQREPYGICEKWSKETIGK